MSVNTHPSQKLVMTQAIATAGEETSQSVPAIIRKGKETTLRQEPGFEVKRDNIQSWHKVGQSTNTKSRIHSKNPSSHS